MNEKDTEKELGFIKMFNSIKYQIENGIKMAFAEQIGKLIRPKKRENDEMYTKEEKEKLEEMRRIKGDVKVPSPDYKQRQKKPEHT